MNTNLIAKTAEMIKNEILKKEVEGTERQLSYIADLKKKAAKNIETTISNCYSDEWIDEEDTVEEMMEMIFKGGKLFRVGPFTPDMYLDTLAKRDASGFINLLKTIK